MKVYRVYRESGLSPIEMVFEGSGPEALVEVVDMA